MVSEGKLEPTDLLRGVGMTEWVVASRVKGLFPKAETVLPPKKEVKPQVEDELGLAPLEPEQRGVIPAAKPSTPASAAKPAVSKPATPASAVKSAVSKPTVKPAVKPVAASPATPAGKIPQPQTPVFPTVPQPPNISDPFASFGAAQAPANDPFAFGVAGLGNLDALVALEKQGQAIYREPEVTAEPDPFAKKGAQEKAAVSDWVSDLGPAGPILVLLMPFGAMLILGFFCGAIYGLRMYIMGLFTYFMAMGFIFSMTSGVTKLAGLFAGNCLLRLKIKNEILALGYGALLGIFSLYVFMAGHIWMTINANPFRGMNNDVKIRAVDEDGRNLALEPDQPMPFGNQDIVPPGAEEAAAETTEEEDAEEMEEVELTAEDKKEKAAILAEEPEPDDWENDARKLADLLDKFENGISIVGSFSPFYVYLSFLPFGIMLWPVNAIILILGTAHATWTSNLGYDPTKGGM
jgi:hypothetical protein